MTTRKQNADLIVAEHEDDVQRKTATRGATWPVCGRAYQHVDVSKARCSACRNDRLLLTQRRPQREVLVLAAARNVRPSDCLIRWRRRTLQRFSNVISTNQDQPCAMSGGHNAYPTCFQVERRWSRH